MPLRKLFSRSAVAIGLALLQIGAAGFVLGQTAPQRSPAQLTRRPAESSKADQALQRARTAMTARNYAQAYREYRTALESAPRTGAQHDEAVRGFSESGVQLAQQRLKEGRAPEAERITREVLAVNAKYRPAVDLLTRTRLVIGRDLPAIGAGPPPDHRTILPQATRPLTPKMDKRSRPESSPIPQVTLAPRPTPAATLPPVRGETAEPPPPPPPEASEEPLDLPEEGPVTSAGPEEEPPAPTPATVKVKQPLVKVFFATDRQRAPGASGPSKYFGTQLNETGDNLTTGFVTVSIPPVHKEGVVERPFKWWIIEFKEDPKKHFVLTDLKVMKSDDFYGALQREYEGRAAEKRSAFVFIHGFTVAFDEAAFNTAQIAYDLDLEAVPILYSWPSQERLLGYGGDQEIVDWSSPHLQRFLERVARESGALRIHVLAHSMGNRLLAKALVGLTRQPDILPVFENVVMAAPDVNAKNFAQDWPEIRKAAKRFTLYASSHDRALIASRESKGGLTFTRLGEGRPNIVVIPGLDTVDASGIDTSLLGHSYADSCKPVMNDLKLLIAEGWPPDKRHLKDQHKGELAYWTFP